MMTEFNKGTLVLLDNKYIVKVVSQSPNKVFTLVEDLEQNQHEVMTRRLKFKTEEKFFYIRKEGYLGNAYIWWKKGGNGYTEDIREAEKFSREQAENLCKRMDFSAYECEYIDNLLEAQKLIIDSQYVDFDKELFNN